MSRHTPDNSPDKSPFLRVLGKGFQEALTVMQARHGNVAFTGHTAGFHMLMSCKHCLLLQERS